MRYFPGKTSVRPLLALLLSTATGVAAVAYGVSLWQLVAHGLGQVWARLVV